MTYDFSIATLIDLFPDFSLGGPRAAFRRFRQVWAEDIVTADVEDFAVAYMAAYNRHFPNTF
jgi:hypothetical protein